MTRDEIQSVALRDVQVADGFFSRYADLVREEVIPYQWEALNDRIPGAEKSGCLRNFRIAAGREAGEFTGMVFQDSDIGKWLEAVAYSLTTHPDAALERTADEVIELLEAAQREDGYLDTYFIVKDPKNRWKCLRDCHELYCAGHLLEGAVAYWQATGKDRFLNVMRRYVDYIATVFGRGEGQMRGYPGHEEIELALCKLYDVTGEKKYLDLAAYFIDERGRDPKYFLEERKTRGDAFHWEGNDAQGMEYFQAHAPVREQTEAVGHAVRAVYLYSGMADVAMRTGDEGLLEACRRLYRNIADKRLYVTGAIGSTYIGEAFTFDYDLPNDTAYAETCASVGLIFFMKRMLEADGAAEYGDMMERALYNTVLAGMAMDGKSFFYVNPLEVFPEADEKDPSKRHVKTVRQKWFACACCPPNVARLLADLGSYIYRRKGSAVTADLFIGSRLALPRRGARVLPARALPGVGRGRHLHRALPEGERLHRHPEGLAGRRQRHARLRHGAAPHLRQPPRAPGRGQGLPDARPARLLPGGGGQRREPAPAAPAGRGAGRGGPRRGRAVRHDAAARPGAALRPARVQALRPRPPGPRGGSAPDVRALLCLGQPGQGRDGRLRPRVRGGERLPWKRSGRSRSSA